MSFKLPYISPGNCQGKCITCEEELADASYDMTGKMRMRVMIVCQTCGNKRCPKATYHEHECTGSNEPNQEGSVYQYERRDHL